jgi:hypothetical protein
VLFLFAAPALYLGESVFVPVLLSPWVLSGDPVATAPVPTCEVKNAGNNFLLFALFVNFVGKFSFKTNFFSNKKNFFRGFFTGKIHP